MPMLAAVVSLFLSACGGGSGTTANPPVNEPPPPQPTSGIVGLVITDKPTETFSAIKLDIVQAILIGDDGQELLFEGPRQINLLDLTNYSEPVLFERVAAGTYTKLRLYIDNLELVSMDGNESWFPKLPANGKVDLLDQDGFAVLPGRTMIIEVDIDANKSIKVTGTGNGKYQFRPVVKVDILDGGLQDKLARLEGFVAETYDDPAGSFLVCHAIEVDNCITVRTGMDTSVFDMEGAPTDMTSLMVDDPVVVIGRYNWDDSGNSDIWLDAIIVEIGGNAVQVKGNVVSDPANDEFLLQKYDDSSLVVELQDGTRFFDPTGEVGPDSIVLGTDVEVEGVMPAVGEGEAARIRAALVFVMPEDADQASGTIADEPDAGTRSFMLTPEAGGNDICVNVAEEASVLLVDVGASEILTGTFDELAMDQLVDLFGQAPDAEDGCFLAEEVIVEVTGGGGP
jgi:hypothetical protein